MITDYHKQLIEDSSGDELTLTVMLYNAWMIDFYKVYDLLHAATGKKRFYIREFEATAKFLLTHEKSNSRSNNLYY